MKNFTVKISESERDSILELLCAENPTQDDIITSHLLLKNKLANCQIVPVENLAENTVTLGKIIAIKTSFGSKSGLKLVTPDQADMDSKKFSILSSLGCTLYGHKAGDIVKWKLNNFIEEIEILSVKKERPKLLSIFYSA